MMKDILRDIILITAFFSFLPVTKAQDLPSPDFTVTARDLYAEFRPSIEAGTTEVKTKYTGKVVRITGEVKGNSKAMGEHEVTLVANDAMGAAYCTIKPEASEVVIKVQKGETITLQCISTGWLIGPAFKDCVLVPVTESNTTAQPPTISIPPIPPPISSGVVYTNTKTGMTVELPIGFTSVSVSDESATFNGPSIGGSLTSIHINTFPIAAGLGEEQIFTINLNSAKQNKNLYSMAEEYNLPNAKAYRARETDKTNPTDPHREYLFVFSKGFQTNIMFAGSKDGLEQSKELIDNFFKSVRVP